MNKEEYRENKDTTGINHFYEKLLMLKDMMMEQVIFQEERKNHLIGIKKLLKLMVKIWDNRCA